MKSDIHPKYLETAVTCGCGNSFTTRSTVEKIQVEVCSACHPFYTGKQKFVDTAGRVEKFTNRFAWKDGSTGKVVEDEKKKRAAEVEKISAKETVNRDERVQRQKSNADRRSKLLEQKKKEAEENAAAAAAKAEKEAKKAEAKAAEEAAKPAAEKKPADKPAAKGDAKPAAEKKPSKKKDGDAPKAEG